jgi:hypothetical protein
VRAQALIAVARDAASMMLAVWIALHEELTGRIHPELLTLAGLLLGVPGATALLHLSRGKQEQPAITESSQSSPSHSSQP